MDASIIIPTRNRRTLLLALLESLGCATTDAKPAEIIVVDDKSTDGTTDAVREYFPQVLVLPGAGVGPSAARNLGASEATGDLLLFLDADGEVEASWLHQMLLYAAPNTLLLGNVVDFHGGRIQSVPRRSTFLGKSVLCQPGQANTGPSCNLGVARSVFEALGGFDEELPYYFEDSDLCIRARRMGFQFRFVKSAVFRHHGNERKTGEAIRLQEKHSTYAMLKGYEDSALLLIAFCTANTFWMLARYVWWNLCGRREEARLLMRGWYEAHTHFLGPRV